MKPSVVSEWVEFGKTQPFLSLLSPSPPAPSSFYLPPPSASPAFSSFSPLRRSDLSSVVPSTSALLVASVIAPFLAVLSPTELSVRPVLCYDLRASVIPDANPRAFVVFVGSVLDLRVWETIQVHFQILHQFRRMEV